MSHKTQLSDARRLSWSLNFRALRPFFNRSMKAKWLYPDSPEGLTDVDFPESGVTLTGMEFINCCAMADIAGIRVPSNVFLYESGGFEVSIQKLAIECPDFWRNHYGFDLGYIAKYYNTRPLTEEQAQTLPPNEEILTSFSSGKQNEIRGLNPL